MLQRIFIAIALLFCIQSVNAQLSFHRTYMSNQNDTIFYHTNSTAINGELTSMGIRRFENDRMGLVIFNQDNKGNINWQKEVDFGKDSVQLNANSDLIVNESIDSFFFMIWAIEDGGQNRQYYGAIDKDGTTADIRKFRGNEFVDQSGSGISLSPFVNGSNIVSARASRPTIARLGQGFEEVWSRSYQFENTDGDFDDFSIIDTETTLDSTILLLGNTITEENILVTELDSNGVQLWSERLSIPNATSTISSQVIRLNNRNTVIAGSMTNGSDEDRGFLITLDTLGEILSTIEFQVDGFDTRFRDVIQGSDGNTWISGHYSENDSLKAFITNIDLNGEVVWTSIFNTPNNVVVPGLQTSDLFIVEPTGGAILGGHGRDNDQEVFAAIKLDNLGMTPCSDTIPTTATTLAVQADTLIASGVIGGVFFEELDYTFESESLLSPPTLSIMVPGPFCPNEMIDTILVANVGGVEEENISYLWNDGSTNDTLRIFDDGEYTVTVTITEDVCYSMCDTVMVNRHSLPMVTLGQSIGDFCETGLVTVGYTYMPGAPSVSGVVWSTGEETETIMVAPPTTVSITLTDECNEIATASLDVTEPPVEITSPIADFNCLGETILISSAAIGAETYSWSFNGNEVGTNSTLTIQNTPENLGVYTITFLNSCGRTATTSVDVQVLQEAILETECIEEEEGNTIVISVFDVNGEINDALMVETFNDDTNSSLGNSNPITLPANLNYRVVVSNGCGDTPLLEQVLDATSLCGQFFRYPNVFFPEGSVDEEETFGPIPSDTMNIDLVTESEFKIFNRWGQEVYSSTELLPSWDGTQGGSDAPSEVYIYFHKYMIEGREEPGFQKGDVTLIR